MSNMSYCQFQNTNSDVRDILNGLFDKGFHQIIKDTDSINELRSMKNFRSNLVELLEEFDEGYLIQIDERIEQLKNNN